MQESEVDFSTQISDVDLQEYNTLCTRSNVYTSILEQINDNASNKTPHTAKKDSRHKHHLKCKEHYLSGPNWVKENDGCANCILFSPSPLPNRRLPTIKQVLCYYFYLCLIPTYHHHSPDRDSAIDVMNHWIMCNVYTIALSNIVIRVKTLLSTYKHLKEYPKQKKAIKKNQSTEPKYWVDYNQFIEQCVKLFDIIGDDKRIKSQGKVWKLPMIK